jgi:hypothetical protein
MEDDRKPPQGGANQGEGNKTADEQYRRRATEFARRTDTLQKGMEAEREVENYRDEYERAEDSGKSRSAGDLQSDLEGKNDRRRLSRRLVAIRPRPTLHLVQPQVGAQGAVPELVALARPHAERALEVLAGAEHRGLVPGQPPECRSQLMVERLQLLASTRFETLAVGDVEQELPGRRERFDGPGVGSEDADFQAGGARILPGCGDRLRIAVGSEHRRQALGRSSGSPLAQLGADPL